MATKRLMKKAGPQLTDRAALKLKTMTGSGRTKMQKRSKKRSSARSVKKVKTPDIFSQRRWLKSEDSTPCAKSKLYLFLLPPTETVIENGYQAQYLPVSNIYGEGPLQFHISGSSDEYMDLRSSYFHVKVKIVKADAKPFVATDNVAPINLFLHSLLSQMDVSLNERVTSSSTNTYPISILYQYLLNFGKDAKKSFLTCEGFYKDTHPDDLSIKGKNVDLKK